MHEKNLEYIIFACTFWDHSIYYRVKEYGNIFIELKGLYQVLDELKSGEYNITTFFFKDCLKQRGINTELFESVVNILDDEINNFDYYFEEYLKKLCEKSLEVNLKKFQSGDLTLDELKSNIQKNIFERVMFRHEAQTFNNIMTDPNFDEVIPTIKISREFFDKYENGLRQNELIVIASRPSKGKSSELKQLVINTIANGERVGIFSYEVPERRIVKDIIATLAGVSKRDYMAGKLNELEIEKVDRIKAGFEDYGKRIFIQDKRPDIDNLCYQAQKMVQQNGVSIIFVDYLTIIPLPKIQQKLARREQISYISNKLQGLSRKIPVVVVLFAQINRTAEKEEEPQLYHLKESGSIEEDGDVIILMSEEQLPSDDNGNPDYTRVVNKNHVAKNRNGATGYYYTLFNRVTGLIKDFPEYKRV